MVMTESEITAELKKCRDSPYYFMTKYWLVQGKPFTTLLSEEEFNKNFRLAQKVPLFKKGRTRNGNTQ